MTYQIRDTFILNGKEFDIEQIIQKSNKWFSPYQYGFIPYYKCTACWRGYHCCYAIKEGRLYLVTLNINNKNDEYPKFMEIEANTINPAEWFKATYNNVFLDFKFTGKIILSRDFIYDKYSKYNEYPSIWMFEKVIELYFRRGKLIYVLDKSEEMHYQRVLDEIKSDLAKDKMVQKILPLCYQWIEENKQNMPCEVENQDLKDKKQANLAMEKLLINLEVKLPGKKYKWYTKAIKNNSIEDDLFRKILLLCEKWMLSNADIYIDESNRRKRSKKTKLTYLKLHLIGFAPSWIKNIWTYLRNKYPYQ